MGGAGLGSVDKSRGRDHINLGVWDVRHEVFTLATDPFNGPSVFHLGYIKSATTYLQNEIFAPETFGCALGGGPDSRAALVSWFVTDDGFIFDPKAVDAAISAAEGPVRTRGMVPIWSDETLLGDPIKRRYTGSDSLTRMARLPRDKKIIISIREQRSMVLSIYREFIRQGGAHTLTQFIGTGREPASYTPILKPDFLLFDRAAAWCMEAFGHGECADPAHRDAQTGAGCVF